MLKWVQLLFSTQPSLIWIINVPINSNGLTFIQMVENSLVKRETPSKTSASRQTSKKSWPIEESVQSNLDPLLRFHFVKIKLEKPTLVSMKFHSSTPKRPIKRYNKNIKCLNSTPIMMKAYKVRISLKWMGLRLFKVMDTRRKTISSNKTNNLITIMCLWWILWILISKT